jgi:polar amino acid transport system substrate-binding protein
VTTVLRGRVAPVKRLLLLALVLALALLAAAGCGGDDGGGAAGTTTTAETDACAKDQLQLKEPGTLTIGTDNPAFSPWFEGGTAEGSDWEFNDPTNGEGFESAVAYAVAEKLGFQKSEVNWIVVPFNQSFRPGEKSFDFDINQISVTAERDRAVDFSDSYYDVNQALVARQDTDLANATTIDEIKQAQLGAQVGTTSLALIEEQVQPEQEPRVFDTSNDVVSAFNAKNVDGIVVDLPTAFFLVDAEEAKNAKVVGQFPAAEGEQEHFGMLFEEGNPLRDCVNRALTELRDEGVLEEIQQQWLSEKREVPVLE